MAGSDLLVGLLTKANVLRIKKFNFSANFGKILYFVTPLVLILFVIYPLNINI